MKTVVLFYHIIIGFCCLSSSLLCDAIHCAAFSTSIPASQCQDSVCKFVYGPCTCIGAIGKGCCHFCCGFHILLLLLSLLLSLQFFVVVIVIFVVIFCYCHFIIILLLFILTIDSVTEAIVDLLTLCKPCHCRGRSVMVLLTYYSN